MELAQLEKEIEALEAEKAAIEERLSSGALSNDEIISASTRFQEVNELLDEKGMRWLELDDLSL